MRNASLRLLIALCLLPLTGCPGSVTADGIDGFTVASASWLVLVSGNAQTHQLVASSVDGYCGKRQSAESKRQKAFEQHQERLEGGATLCESLDTYYDDLAAAMNPLDKAGAKHLNVVLARDVDSQDLDAITAPAAGHYQQLGGVSDGTFTAQLQYHEAKFNQQFADAWDCEALSEEQLDDTIAIATLLAESTAEVEFPTSYLLSAAELDIEEASDSKRSVSLDGDLLEQGTTIGSFQASFTATECLVELSDQLNF